ncbi:MAG TPA: hypothetical protein VHG90_08815, partial [Acidimicrobiales bacterium]|nr:hypothetical protein [Acidimicrobiales bacterium]
MKALVAGELRRLLGRRLVRVLALVAFAAIALTGVLVFVNTEDVSSAELSARRRQAEAEYQQCVERGGPDAGPRELPDEGGPGLRIPVEERCGHAVGGVDDPRFALADLKGILQAT